jgi:ankyrin repeat protein
MTEQDKWLSVNWNLVQASMPRNKKRILDNFAEEDPLFVNKMGWSILTAYLNYSAKPDLDVIAQFVESGVDVHQKTNSGSTAFICAAFNPVTPPEVFSALLSHGASAQDQHHNGWNAFHQFARGALPSHKSNAFAVADCLHSLGVEINSVNRNSEDPLMFCACQFKQFPELTAKMLDLGANPNRVYRQGNCFVSLVRTLTECRTTARKAFELLIKYEFDLDLLTAEDINFLGEDYLQQVIISHQTASLLIFGRRFNKATRFPLKIQKAQSMMQVMFKDICQYLPSGVSLSCSS